jgi:hypothetical protein
MEEVRHEQSFSMSFCLDCHRNPAAASRPLDKVTELDWAWSQDPRQNAQLQIERGRELVRARRIESLQECSTCHR